MENKANPQTAAKNGAASGESNRQKVLRNRIAVCDFVLVDLAEYLDTHPSDPEALAQYKRYLALLREARDAYVDAYGPLKQGDLAESATCWRWVDDPWPWD